MSETPDAADEAPDLAHDQTPDELSAHASGDAVGSDAEPGGVNEADDYDLTESDQDTSGSMGVSSEREGPTGPGQYGTTGVRDVGPAHLDHTSDDEPAGAVPPEQRPGGEERNPDGLPPKATPPSIDPRSDDDAPSMPSADREIDRHPDN